MSDVAPTVSVGNVATSIKADLIEGVTLDRVIGSGATSTVYLGYSKDNPNERFAIKFLTPFLGTNETARMRWEREAELLIALHHPNIVRGFRHGVADHRPYLVMEFLQGEIISDRLRRMGRLPEDEVYTIARSTLLALEEAHKFRVVHRDIKPSNMIWLNDGTVKLMDFGLAKFTEDVSLTSTGSVLGTPIYISPEQASGEKNITIQSDLYSLGSTLFHLVTGRPPFTELNVSLLLTRKNTDDVPDPRFIEKSVSAPMAYFLLSLCARERRDRIATPEDALALLDKIEAGDLSATGFEPVEKSSRAPQRPISRSAIVKTSDILQTVVGDSELATTPSFLEDGEVLFYEDDESFECYILVSGRVEIMKSGRGVAMIEEPGSFIGEMSPLNDVPRSATVVARGDVVLLRIEKGDFQAFFNRHPQMALMLAQSLAKRLEQTTTKLYESSARIAILHRHVREMTAAFKIPID